MWVSEWNAGNLSVYDPAAKDWQVFKLPGEAPHAYAVFVDDKDKVWVSDFAANAILKFDPETSTFESFPSDQPDAAVRQMLGRPGEVWGRCGVPVVDLTRCCGTGSASMGRLASSTMSAWCRACCGRCR